MYKLNLSDPSFRSEKGDQIPLSLLSKAKGPLRADLCYNHPCIIRVTAPDSPAHVDIGLGLRALDGDLGGAAALVALGGHDLVVVGAELEAGFGPGVEMGLHVDGAADALLLAHAPELVEGRGALDRRLVYPLRPVDVVRAAVRRHRAEALRARAAFVLVPCGHICVAGTGVCRFLGDRRAEGKTIEIVDKGFGGLEELTWGCRCRSSQRRSTR